MQQLSDYQQRTHMEAFHGPGKGGGGGGGRGGGTLNILMASRAASLQQPCERDAEAAVNCRPGQTLPCFKGRGAGQQTCTTRLLVAEWAT